MPVDKNLHNPADPLDLSHERFKRGLAGRAGAPVEAATSVVNEGSGGSGALGDPPHSQVTPLGASNIRPPTIGAVTPGSGQLSVAYSNGPDATGGVEMVVVRADNGKLGAVVAPGNSPRVATGLEGGVLHHIYMRHIVDGRVGRAAGPTNGTPS